MIATKPADIRRPFRAAVMRRLSPSGPGMVSGFGERCGRPAAARGGKHYSQAPRSLAPRYVKLDICGSLCERDPEKDVDEREQQESPTLPASAPAGDLPFAARHHRPLWIGRPHRAGRLREEGSSVSPPVCG